MGNAGNEICCLQSALRARDDALADSVAEVRSHKARMAGCQAQLQAMAAEADQSAAALALEHTRAAAARAELTAHKAGTETAFAELESELAQTRTEVSTLEVCSPIDHYESCCSCDTAAASA